MEGDRVGCPYLTHWVSDRPPAVGQTAVLRKVDIVLVLHTVELVLQIGICSSRNNKNGTLKHNAILMLKINFYPFCLHISESWCTVVVFDTKTPAEVKNNWKDLAH